MSTEAGRLTRQDVDLDQTNDQKVDQANMQDASHHSRVTVTVQNHLGIPYSACRSHVCGRVLDAAGTGVAGCTVELFFGPLLGLPVAVEETDHHGRFRVDDLPPGYYSVRATGPDGATAEQWNLPVRDGLGCRVQLCLDTVSVLGRLREAKMNVVDAHT